MGCYFFFIHHIIKEKKYDESQRIKSIKHIKILKKDQHEEINNKKNTPNKPKTNISGLEITDEIKVPEEKIVYIKRPEVEPKKKFEHKPEKTGFVF